MISNLSQTLGVISILPTISFGVSVVLIIVSTALFYREKYDAAAIVSIPAALLNLAVTFNAILVAENIHLYAITFALTIADALAVLAFDRNTEQESPRRVYLMFSVVYHTSTLMYFMCIT